MTEKVKYLSMEWRDEAERKLTTELPPERMNFVTSSMSNIYLNCPGGNEKYLFFNSRHLFRDRHDQVRSHFLVPHSGDVPL